MMRREEMKGRDGGRARLQLHDSQDRFSQLSCVRNNSSQPHQIPDFASVFFFFFLFSHCSFLSIRHLIVKFFKISPHHTREKGEN